MYLTVRVTDPNRPIAIERNSALQLIAEGAAVPLQPIPPSWGDVSREWEEMSSVPISDHVWVELTRPGAGILAGRRIGDRLRVTTKIADILIAMKAGRRSAPPQQPVRPPWQCA